MGSDYELYFPPWGSEIDHEKFPSSTLAVIAQEITESGYN